MWEIALFFIGTNVSLHNAINLGNWNFYGNIKLKAFLNSFLTCEIFSLISTLNRVLIFCVEFRELFHLTCDLSQAEKKRLRSKKAKAYTINCLCQSILTLFILFGIYNFGKKTNLQSQLMHVLLHGLRTPNEAFFIEIQNFWAWTDKLGR